MATSTSKRIKAHAALHNSKKDKSPKWEGAATWDASKFSQYFRESMDWYRLEKSAKDLKPQVINWMGRNGFGKKQIDAFKKTKDSRCSTTMGAIAANLNNGMPATHPGFNQGRDSQEWLTARIKTVILNGEDDERDEEVKDKPATSNTVVFNIQDRLKETAGAMSLELDAEIDNWIVNADEFDPKSFKIANLLRGKGAKAAHARFIKSFYQNSLDELMELASGKADDQLREAYGHKSRKNVKKLIEFYELIMAACDQITAEAKVMKKPRAKKIKPAEDQVKKLKFCIKDDKLGIVSVPPAGIIGAQGLVVVNVKTRKIGYYISKDSSGLGVKGTTVTNFTEKSFQKTMRKPNEQLKEFKDQNTQRRFDVWFSKNIKTTETALNGRISKDVVILKVFK